MRGVQYVMEIQKIIGIIFIEKDLLPGNVNVFFDFSLAPHECVIRTCYS